jgi:hypothetical protein
VGVLQSAYEGVAALFEQGQEEEGLGRVAEVLLVSSIIYRKTDN